jgi:hypothetical protein
MTIKHVAFFSAAAVAFGATGCGGGGNATIGAASAQGAGYVPQSAGAAAAPIGASGQAVIQPLPEPLIALGKPGAAPNLTAPVISDSGSYTNGPIIVGTNTTTGFGVEGVTEGRGAGIYGDSTFAGPQESYGVYGVTKDPEGSGVFGYTKTGGAGVIGSSPSGFGVKGVSSTSYGVGGVSSSGNGVIGETFFPSGPSQSFQRAGVQGLDLSSDGGEEDAGVAGMTVNGFGVYGQAAGDGKGAGVYGIGFNRSDGVVGYVPNTATGGVAVDAGNDSSGTGPYGDGDGLSAYSRNATAIVAQGLSSSSTTPVELLYTEGQPFLIGTNTNTTRDTFSIDANGNMILAGNLTVDGIVRSNTYDKCGASCTSPLLGHRAPAVEDTGDGSISGGRGYVRLDPAYAAELDASQSYNVFLTPYGDSKGLYVTGRSPSGFEVHENQNGRSSLSFGYRVVGVAKPAAVASPIRTAASPPRHVVRRIGPAAFRP